MFNKDTLKHSLLKKQSLAILSIIAVGSLFGVVYASGTIVSDTGITTPNLTVTGTCTGCSNEATFTTYTLVTNSTVAGTSGLNGFKILVANDGSVIAQPNNGNMLLIGLNGTVFQTYTSWSSTGWDTFSQSQTGEYKVILDNTSGTIKIFKNNVLIQTITINVTNSFADTHGALGISPSGKYIAFYDSDLSTVIDRIQIWQGS